MPAEQADTIIGAHVELKGSLHNSGPIQIHGKVTGDIISDSLVVIGETAVINGPITAKNIEVSGQVNGSLTGEEQIELNPKSLVKGDLTTGRLSIKPGAVFIGKSQMSTGSVDHEEIMNSDKKRPRVEIE